MSGFDFLCIMCAMASRDSQVAHSFSVLFDFVDG